MRRLVGAFALLAVLVFSFWLILGSGQSPQAQGAAGKKPGHVSFGIYSSELAGWGEANAALVHLFLFEGRGNVSVFCSGRPMQQNVVLLEHAAAPGIAQGLSEKIANELSRCGISSRKAGQETALSSRDSVIISTAGALPSALAGKQRELQDANTRVILVETLAGRAIGENGEISFSNASAGFESVRMLPSGEKAAAFEAARRAIFPGAEWKLELGGAEGNFTASLEVNSSPVFCRAIYIGEDGICRVADSSALYLPAGRLIGPKSVLAGKSAQFEFSPPNGSETGRSLRFSAVSSKGREEVARQEMPGGKITEGWASAFSLNFSSGGQHIVQVFDQFGRLHASAYLEVRALEVSIVSISGNRYEFQVLFGGKPASGAVSAWIDSGGKKQYYASDGALVVWAAPAAGRHVMRFEYGGVASDYVFSAEGGGMLETYAKLGVPAAIFVFAVYFLLRAGRRAKYTITFPQFAGRPLKAIGVSAMEMEKAWQAADGRLGGHGLVLRQEEIGRALAEIKKAGREARINGQSLRAALRQLASQGIFAESEGLFIPSAKMGGFSAGELRTLRLLHDLMLERGLPFRRERMLAVKGRGLELCVFSGKAGVLFGLGKNRRVMVFASREEKEDFEKSLAEPTVENTRVKLAMANGKVALAAATRKELEAVLP